VGFLDHSTNNIIVDAVLTDKGRQLLARNDGSFQITRFSFGDDEVDYNIIKQFGRTVGKEKVEKNTPVFEAQTNSDVGLKNRMISAANPYLTSLPTLSVAAVNGATTLVRGSSPIEVDLQVTQTNFNNATIDLDLRDPSFLVQYDNRFLVITGYEDNVSTPSAGQNYISTVRVRQTSTNSDGSNGSIATFRASIKSFSDSFYSFYSTSANSNQIRTFITVTGTASGTLVTVPILVNKNSSVT
tara:strand:- start:496 stop:1221 length:726 start_codon:yes stop_codon:yes gene_type:complete